MSSDNSAPQNSEENQNQNVANFDPQNVTINRKKCYSTTPKKN